ncbi:MAG: thiamine pyrophosphate-binding protein [Alphaproteobacteria bacterium]|nr:thiamine pyrophosphate-binding protein [Alphaproteobacteria bacterium]
MDAGPETELTWYRVADADAVPEGRVITVVAGVKPIALVRYQGRYAALDNKCPHQGGPLGQGTIENGCLRCPWHGWDFEALTGRSVDGRADGVASYQCELRKDGVHVAVPEPIKHIRTVSDVMVETMVNWGVRHAFGIVGHSNLGLADALRLQEEAGKLTFFGVRHEGAAAFACSGYAKLSGRPAACLGIAGPGSTNLLTGLWDAKVDRAPVLALSGQVDTQVLGPGAFQEIDLASAFAAVSRFSQTVLHDSKHAELMTLALKTATVERDVAHLIFPDEVQTLRAADGVMPSGPAGRIGPDQITPPEDSVKQALTRLKQAKRPLIIVGYGARSAMDGVVRLAEALQAPVVTTFKGKGQISDRHPLAGGVLGRSGTPIASWLMKEADLLLVFGASFSNHTGIDPAKPIIQVDFDRMALGKFHPVDVPVWGEIGLTADLFRKKLPKKLAAEDQRKAVAARWRLWRKEKKRRLGEERGKGVSSAAVFLSLTRQCPDDAVIAVDVGNNTYSFGRYFECARQAVLMSGYLGSIGFAFPAALGAWAAAGHERPILSISGDGGFAQYMAEFTTAVKYGMNITHLLLNNSELGKISLEQRAGQWPVWQTSLHNPDFARFAKLCGGYGVRVTKADQLDDAIAAAIAHDGPALVEVIADPALV